MWWMVNLAIGLGVLYQATDRSDRDGMFVTYLVIALVIAAVRSALSGAYRDEPPEYSHRG